MKISNDGAGESGLVALFSVLGLVSKFGTASRTLSSQTERMRVEAEAQIDVYAAVAG